MAERFIKLNLNTDSTEFLIREFPDAFAILSLISIRARRTSGQADGLIIGDAIIGFSDMPGMSRQNFRTGLRKLVEFKYIEIIWNGKKFLKRKKSTIKITIKSTLVNLLNSDIYDINSHTTNHQNNQQLTNSQPTANHKQERRRMNKKEKDHHPSTPSSTLESDDDRVADDFSSKIEIISGVLLSQDELDACLKIKGTLEKVREAIAFIQASKNRKREIRDWPLALSKWKIKQNPFSPNLEFAEALCREFEDFRKSRGWRCYFYTDGKKDERGLLFENESAYQQAFFVALLDGEFQQKCERFISEKKMRSK